MLSLELPSGSLTVVCLAAHPDDIEIASGGTLLELATRGDVNGHWLTLTGDSARTAEAVAAAEAFLPGAHTEFHQFPDGRLPAYWNAVKDALHNFSQQIPAPDLVLAPRVDDAHQDHRLLGRLASTVWRDAAIWHFEVPKWDGDLRSSNFYVPISAENGRRKVDLLNKHYLSQTHHDWWDDEMFLGLMRIRGMECRSRYAEGFYVTKSITQIAPRR
jgi:LmbE family N-acetylglucosaminyl deacetylase